MKKWEEIVAELAEHRQFTPAEVGKMTLPQLHAVYVGSKNEGETIPVQSAEHLEALLAKERGEEDWILGLMEEGVIR